MKWIDSLRNPWLLGTSLAAGLALGLYLAVAAAANEWPAGGSTVGLWYGLVGTALMAAAGLLVVVRRLPLSWRIGSRPGWLRAHLWLGSLSAVFLSCHSGFRWGGLLEQLLWLTAGGVVLTGVVGFALQRLLPRLLTARVPHEVPPGYHEHTCRALLRRADALVDQACGTFDGRQVSDPGLRSAEDARRQLRAFFETEVRPFLSRRTRYRELLGAVLPRRSPLADPLLAEGLFARLQGMSALADYRPLLEQLAASCEERRQLAEQQRLWFWMHAWLLIHVPLSAALLVLMVAHVVAGSYY